MRQLSPWRCDKALTGDDIRLERQGRPEHREPPCSGAGFHPAGSKESVVFPSREDPCFAGRQRLRWGAPVVGGTHRAGRPRLSCCCFPSHTGRLAQSLCARHRGRLPWQTKYVESNPKQDSVGAAFSFPSPKLCPRGKLCALFARLSVI